MGSENDALSDEAIVAMVLREPAFFGHIIDRYQAKLDRYIARLGVRNPEDREDVLQEVFIKVYRNLNNFDPALSFSSWIYRITHNEAISWYRRQKVRPEGHLIDDNEPALSLIMETATDAEQQFDESINAELVKRALGELDERYRTVLLLRYFEHKEYEEISDILKIPIGTVGTLVHRGKKQLRKKVEEHKIRL